MPIEARPVDPRDVTQEVLEPPFRAYFWADRTCREFELTGGDVLEAREWADRERRDGERYDLHAVARTADGVVLLRVMSS